MFGCISYDILLTFKTTLLLNIREILMSRKCEQKTRFYYSQLIIFHVVYCATNWSRFDYV